MNSKPIRPSAGQVRIKDKFWTPYLDMIRKDFMIYVFDKFEEIGYFNGFHQVRDGITGQHPHHPFADGLIFESMRGACDFLAVNYDAELDARLDKYIGWIKEAQDTLGDGYVCTRTTCMYPEQRWGENGGDIVIQHDLYDQGALVEASIAHYMATGKTNLLEIAVKSANLICDYVGLPPKHNIITGHSLPEEAFIKFYRLFRDCRALDSFASEHGVNKDEYLRVALFWLDNRGNYEGRETSPKFSVYFNQDHLPLSKQTTAEGHAVRAGLFYTGAATAAYETDNADYRRAVNAIWENITGKKLHISGGVGTRHDIEGFDADYNLPNNAYLETCAAIALAFFNGEMNLLERDAKYMDYFERSLYNNVLGSISSDAKEFTYQNPLITDGSFKRNPWHNCPCCPPMQLKLFSSLGTYVCAYTDTDIYVNLYIGSRVETELFTLTQEDGKIALDSKGKSMTLRLRLPEYAEELTLTVNGKSVEYEVKNGYALLSGVWSPDVTVALNFKTSPRRVFAHPDVEADRGQVAVMMGAKLYCAEGIDNGGDVDFEIAEAPELTVEGENITGKTADGGRFTLIPYYLWGNRRTDKVTDSALRVWFRQENMPAEEILREKAQGRLYMDY
ncbi:MAG: glycoside hydrolase family 127 protein [Clostridia bacterium]|nr:glycoside hydrolase family 127 protein [Clostridia bacterium]